MEGLSPWALRMLEGLAELMLTAVMAVLVVYATLRALIRTNTDFDEDKEILKGNVAVGILVSALLLASANIMHSAFAPVCDVVHLYFTTPIFQSLSQWQLIWYAGGNLILAFIIVVATLSAALRFFGRLTRTKQMRPGRELEKGNIAVGILLSCFVLIVSFFVGEGVRALSRAMLPRPVPVRIDVLR